MTTKTTQPDLHEGPPTRLEAEPDWTSPKARHRHRSTGPTAQQNVLSIRASVPEADADEFVAGALRDVRVYMQEHHVHPDGPPFLIRRPTHGVVDVEAGWPVATPVPGTSRIHAGALPPSLLEPETGRAAG